MLRPGISRHRKSLATSIPSIVRWVRWRFSTFCIVSFGEATRCPNGAEGDPMLKDSKAPPPHRYRLSSAWMVTTRHHLNLHAGRADSGDQRAGGGAGSPGGSLAAAGIERAG